MQLIKRRTDVDVMLRGDWQRESFVLPHSAANVRDVMDDLAAAFGGHWFQQGSAWVLAGNQEEARLTAIPDAQREDMAAAELTNVIKSLAPGQWAELGKVGQLDLGHLDARQREGLMTYTRLFYFDPHAAAKDSPSADALTGKNVRLILNGQGRDCILTIQTGNGFYPYLFVDPRDGKTLTFGVPPPR